MLIPYTQDPINCNSYLSIDEYKALTKEANKNKLDSLEDGKETLLIQASKIIDNVYRWKGSKTHKEQNLEFPRDGKDLPIAIKIATVALIDSILNDLDTKNIKSESISKLSVTYKDTVMIDDSIKEILNTLRDFSIKVRYE